MPLPIVERELRGRARRRSTYRARLGAGLVSILFVAGLLVATERWVAPARLGQFIFWVLGGLALAWSLLEGVRTTADCLSEEKRQGTLGLLFLTRLHSWDVVLGKLAAHGLNSLFYLLAILPALAVPIILGGVLGGELGRLALALINTLFLSLSGGLLVSTLVVRERRAWLGTLLLMAVLALAPLAVRGGLSGAGSGLDLLSLSPLVAYAHVYDTRYALDPQRYWQSLVLSHGLGWLFLGAACVILPRTWRAGASGQVEDARLLPRWLSARRKPGQATRWSSANPVAFLVNYRAPHPWLLAGVLGLLACAGLYGWSQAEFDPRLGFQLLLAAVGSHGLLSAWMAAQACHAMAANRDSGMLELLLTTPLSAEQIIRGHHLGLWQGFGPAVLVLAVVELFALAVHGIVLGFTQTSSPAALLAWIGLLGATLHDIDATAWFGLWAGLTTRKPSRAWGRTILLVLGLPATFALCCAFFWPLPILIKNVVIIHWARDRLRHRLRATVADRFGKAVDTSDLLGGQPHRPPRQPPLPPVLPAQVL